jgi:hypothetical protein
MQRSACAEAPGKSLPEPAWEGESLGLAPMPQLLISDDQVVSICLTTESGIGM